MRFDYRVILTPDGNDTILVTCPDLPEVTTFGKDRDDAVLRARDAIEEAIAARIADREEIPQPSAVRRRRKGKVEVVPLAAATALKVLLYRAMREQGVRKADLVRRLGVHGPQIDRLLDVRHASRLDQLEAALAAMGKRLVVDLEETAR